jgi:hypothetical protein
MTILNFKSPLAECLNSFIGYKHAMNCKYRTEANVLQMFDRYLCDYGISDCESIDTAVIEGFLKSRPRRTAGKLQPSFGHNARIFPMGSRAEVHQTQPGQSGAPP